MWTARMQEKSRLAKKKMVYDRWDYRLAMERPLFNINEPDIIVLIQFFWVLCCL